MYEHLLCARQGTLHGERWPSSPLLGSRSPSTDSFPQGCHPSSSPSLTPFLHKIDKSRGKKSEIELEGEGQIRVIATNGTS